MTTNHLWTELRRRDVRTHAAEKEFFECKGVLAKESRGTNCTVCGLIIDEFRIDH